MIKRKIAPIAAIITVVLLGLYPVYVLVDKEQPENIEQAKPKQTQTTTQQATSPEQPQPETAQTVPSAPLQPTTKTSTAKTPVSKPKPSTPPATPPTSPPSTPVVRLLTDPQVQQLAQRILDSQLPSGAIAHYTDKTYIVPYFSHLAAMGLIKSYRLTGNEAYYNSAKNWVSWYEGHMDINGYVTDYSVSGAVETSTGNYDSTDSYAALYLIVLELLQQAKPSDYNHQSHAMYINLARSAIASTQQPDGLTWAKPAWKVKYLMDNTETLKGLQSGSRLTALAGNTAEKTTFDNMAAQVRSGISSLWNGTSGWYHWAKFENNSLQSADLSYLYNDSLQQVWPHVWGIEDSSRGALLVNSLRQNFPSWNQPAVIVKTNGGMNPAGYWPMVVWAECRMGQTDRAKQSMTNIMQGAVSANYAWPFHSGLPGAMLYGNDCSV